MKYILKTYQTTEHKRPFTEWLNAVSDRTTRAVIRARLDRLEQGNFGKCEPVGNGVFELKIYYGPGYRVYFGKIGEDVVLLLCGGDKGSQKSDIQKATVYFKDYQSRGENDD